jgi:hypothetical protein
MATSPELAGSIPSRKNISSTTDKLKPFNLKEFRRIQTEVRYFSTSKLDIEVPASELIKDEPARGASHRPSQ